MVAEGVIFQAARALLAACPNGSQVILFGSHARDQAHSNSDMDFLVIEPHAPNRLAEAARLARVLRPLRIPADILVISRDLYEQWKHAPNTIFNEAALHGRVIA